MADATDDLLMAFCPALARAQVVEVKVKLATDGEYELDLEGVDPVIFAASGNTITDIRDGLADPIVSPAFDPYAATKIITDRFRVRGSKGDPFTFALTAPGGAANATATIVQTAQGATTDLRLRYLGIAVKLIKADVWGDLTAEGQCLLAAYFCEAALNAQAALDGLAAGGQASSLSLGGASASLTGNAAMPSAAAMETSVAYGQPLLILMRAKVYGPMWS